MRTWLLTTLPQGVCGFLSLGEFLIMAMAA
jgi:hypothetical protein